MKVSLLNDAKDFYVENNFMLKIITFVVALTFPFITYSQSTDKRAVSINELNGSPIPGAMARSIDQKRLITIPDGTGNHTIIEQTTRASNTRTPIHIHDFSGITCVIEGEMTLYLEDAHPTRAIAGECYHMPAGLMMVGFNSGSNNAVMHDIFTTPIDAPIWRVVEEGSDSLQDQFQKHH